MLVWLRKESIALIGVAGAAVTVLAYLRHLIPFAPWLVSLLEQWQSALRWVWHPPLELVGAPIHPHIVAGMSLVVFLTMMGIGARISRNFSADPLPPLTLRRWLDDQSWPSLAVFAALNVVFLMGQDAGQRVEPLVLFGSKEWGRFAFGVFVTVGYVAGDFIGHREFHHRLVRLAVLVALLVALNLAAVYGPDLVARMRV